MSGTWWSRHAVRCNNNPLNSLNLQWVFARRRGQNKNDAISLCFVRFSRQQLFPYTALQLDGLSMWTQCLLQFYTSFGRISKPANFPTENFLAQIWEYWIGKLYLGAFAKLRKVAISFFMSVRPSICPHGTTRVSLDGFSWNLIFEYFSKICREKSSFSKIGQE
jgi:hypothetical protein